MRKLRTVCVLALVAAAALAAVPSAGAANNVKQKPAWEPWKCATLLISVDAPNDGNWSATINGAPLRPDHVYLVSGLERPMEVILTLKVTDGLTIRTYTHYIAMEPGSGKSFTLTVPRVHLALVTC